MIMSEGGELQAVFVDYFLVTKHTGLALMIEIYVKTFVKKLKLGPADIRDQCTGADFDGQYFHLGCPEIFSIMVVEKAKGAAPTGAEVNSVVEWLLCTWDQSHRMELVANDIRVDQEGVHVELMVVPCYSQATKNIAAMSATCRYGKQYEELLETAGHLGERWHAMVKFCDTRFVQSKLEVYINFEKNYIAYRRAWGGSNTKAEEETTTTSATTTASTIATTTTTSTTTVATKATTSVTRAIATPVATTTTATTTTTTQQQQYHEQQLYIAGTSTLRTPYGGGYKLREMIMLLKEGLEQRPQEKLPNRGQLELHREQQRKKQLMSIQVLPRIGRTLWSS
jgi:hypothetical protein